MDYDIVIVGAGVTGLTCAVALSTLPLKIAVLERKPPSSAWSSNHVPAQVSAVTPSTEGVFRRLGVWSDVMASRVTPFKRMFVWDAVGTGQIEFQAAEIGWPHLGHIIENNVLIDALVRHCGRRDNISLYFNAQIERYSVIDHQVQIQTNFGLLTASLAVAADGAHSWLRQQVGIEHTVKPYQQSAIVTTVATEFPHQSTAWQCFLPRGPLAFLPLTAMPQHPHLASIVWSTASQEADRLMSMNTAEFEQALADAFDHRLGQVTVLGPRVDVPLVMRHAHTYSLNQVVLIGDAAHTIHPLAGQGLNLGVMDACALAEAIKRGREQHRPLYSQKILRAYESGRRTENQTMALMMQGFDTLFSRDGQMIPSVRSMGLQLVDRCRPLKHQLLRRAMGLMGERPPLARVEPSEWLSKTEKMTSKIIERDQ